MFLCVFDELHIYQFIVLIGTLIYIGCNGYFHIIFYCLRCDDSIDTPESIFIGTVDRCFNVFGRCGWKFLSGSADRSFFILCSRKRSVCRTKKSKYFCRRSFAKTHKTGCCPCPEVTYAGISRHRSCRTVPAFVTEPIISKKDGIVKQISIFPEIPEKIKEDPVTLA
mgnify:CR=1 FL=1